MKTLKCMGPIRYQNGKMGWLIYDEERVSVYDEPYNTIGYHMVVGGLSIYSGLNHKVKENFIKSKDIEIAKICFSEHVIGASSKTAEHIGRLVYLNIELAEDKSTMLCTMCVTPKRSCRNDGLNMYTFNVREIKTEISAERSIKYVDEKDIRSLMYTTKNGIKDRFVFIGNYGKNPMFNSHIRKSNKDLHGNDQ